MATFVLNKRNNANLIYKGYEYRRHRITKHGQTYWYCRQHDRFKCKSKAYTMQIGTENRVRITGQHSHLPEKQS